MKTTIKTLHNKIFIFLLIAWLCAASAMQFKVLAQVEPATPSDGSAVSLGTVTQQQKLLANDGAVSDAFGWSVSASGNLMVIGSPLADVNGKTNQGAAYVYAKTNGVWTLQTKLTADEGSANAQFGFTVAIDGDTIVIGARTTAPSNKGAAYVFVRSNAAWIQQAKLLGTDTVNHDRFGEAVAINGNTIIVGAVLHDPSGTPDTNKGAAYVFIRENATWTQQAKLTASTPQDYAFFGSSVAIDANTILIGAPESSRDIRVGAAYVFTRTGTVWTEQAKLMADDSTYQDDFGFSLSVSGDTAVVGALGSMVAGTSFAGAAYIFTRSNDDWAQQAKLTADAADIGANNNFGWAVSLKNDALAIGAYSTRVDGKLQQGTAYLFKRNGALWEPQARLTANDGLALDYFGSSVALNNDEMLIGTPQKSPSGANTQQPGAVYVFALTPADSQTPQIQSVQVKGKKLLVTGVNFESPTEIYVNGERQKKTANDIDNPTTLVIAAKSGRWIAPGQTVMIQVKNTASGKVSSEIMYTRPLE
ncbi:MAG: FG-GAP repeat protein [Acidobacteriota bacterium]